VGCITEEMREIEYCINRIVDFKEAELQNTFVVKLGVDEDLDRCKSRHCHSLYVGLQCICILVQEVLMSSKGLHSKSVVIKMDTVL
jgi:hypothetical protein